MTTKNNKTLHLVLKHKWWNMEFSGEKPEEYRSITPKYIKRFCYTKQTQGCEHSKKKGECEKCFYSGEYMCYPFEKACMHKGYTNETATYDCNDICFGKGNPEWGAPQEDVFIIKLGNKHG